MPRNLPERIIFTDLDGTLVDHSTYAFDDAIPALNRVKTLGIPLCICSSKTKAEILDYQARLDIHDPFISENGGAVFVPAAHGFEVVPVGMPYQKLVNELRSLRDELRIPLRGFHELKPEELAAMAGMSLKEAGLALQRDFDEPFWLMEDAAGIAELRTAASSRGLQVSRGGRFLHLHGSNDKGKAVGILMDILGRKRGRLISAGMGDSPNDIPMLKRVDQSFLVQKPDGSHDPEVLAQVSNIIPVAGVGPRGWQIAVAEFIDEPTLK